MAQESLNKLFEIINYIFAGFSLVCSFFVVLIINRNKKAFASVNNQFVIQLLYSEIINNLTQLSSMFLDVIGSRETKYDERMRICYPQVFTGLFSNFYCLSSTLLISFHLYDLFIKHGQFFGSQKNVRICRNISFYGCLFVSYILFIFQMNHYQSQKHTQSKLRTISCWVSEALDWVACSIFIILIILTCVFSFKCYFFIRNFSKIHLTQDSSDDDSNEIKQTQINRVNSMQKRLIVYPFINIIVFIFLLIHRFLVYIGISDRTDNNAGGIVISFILYTIPTCIRGMLYTFVYFGCQQMFRDELKKFFCCYQKGDEVPATLTEMEVQSNSISIGDNMKSGLNDPFTKVKGNYVLYDEDIDDEED